MQSLLTSLLVLAIGVLAADVSETLVISRGVAAPDCRNTSVLLVNGTFTGPTITTTQGDRLSPTIVNELDGPFSMHLHGINQVGTPFSDGAAGVTTMPIPPRSTATHASIMTDHGTFFYHAHFKLLDLHVYGPLIVKSPAGKDPYAGYEERVLMLSDYWTADVDALHAGLVNTPVFKSVGAPQAFLTNGKTIAMNCTAPEPKYASLDVQKGKTYRVRLVGATSLFVVHFRIPQHKLTLVELEGTYVTPKVLDYIEVLPGQRMSFLVTADQPADNYWMQMTGKWRKGAPANGFSVLHYKDAAAPISTPPALLPSINETLGWQEQFSPLDQATTIPPAATAPLVLNGNQIAWGVNGTQRRWAINGTVYEHYHHSTLLEDVIAGTVSSRPVGARPMAYFKTDQVVDIVLQNNVALNGACDLHPWHLHGHSFWVVNSGAGDYDPSSASSDRTLAVKRDVVAIYPHHAAYNQPAGTPGAGCGWAKIRFVANNVGAWPLHCHITSHFAMGMAASFVVGEESLRDPAFVEQLRCQSAGSRCRC